MGKYFQNQSNCPGRICIFIPTYFNSTATKNYFWDGKMAESLYVFAGVTEDRSLVSSTNIRRLTNIYNYSTRGFDALL